MIKSLRTVAVLSVLTPACALAQAPAPAPAPQAITQESANLANCAIARNAGDARWLGAIITKQANLTPAIETGAQMSAVQIMFYGCPVTGADIGSAIRIIGAMLPFHPGAINLPRRSDALADCTARAVPREALTFVVGVDTKVAAKDPAPAKGYPALLAKAGKSCAAELTKLDGKVQENELYSRLNWALRAAPALAQSPTTKPAGR